ncbi:MAG: hypothetical protein IJL19_07865 [Clostridiales bacterium]|nr:hypothetical protein [Clostridiales bacterium]
MAKTSKSGKKANKKVVSGGLGTVIVVIVLIIAIFFVYISGILPSTVTGVSIKETLPDGTVKTVRNFNILETNLHFKEVFNQYSSYGMVTEDMLDVIYDTEKNETYRDMLLREAASQMRTMALVERAAKESGFIEMSKARDFAAADLESLDSIAKMYGYQSAQQYMAALYGTGMTTRKYIEYSSREILVEEYGAYLKQFDPAIVPSDEAIQAKYNEDPSSYMTVTFNNYFISGADSSGNATALSLAEAVAEAQKIADASKGKDSAYFRQAVMNYLTAQGDEETLAGYDNLADPTLYKNYTYASVSYMNADICDFLYGDAVAGDVKVTETDKGAYVTLLVEKKLNDTQTVAYRTLTLTNDVASQADATPEQILAGAQAIANDATAKYVSGSMDSLAFYNLVKSETTNTQDMLTGGYNSGVTAESLLSSSSDAPLDTTKVEMGMWLFDEARQQGDIKVFISSDQTQVYVLYFEFSAPAWYNTARNTITSDNFNAWNASLSANDPRYEVNQGLIRALVY